MHRARTRLVAIVAAAAFALAACGGGATPSPTASAPATAAPSGSPSAAPSEGVDEYDVAVGMSPAAGDYLTGAGGLALYTFTNDTGSDSTCYEACAAAWPPLLADGDVAAGPGVGGTFATTERTDGTTQVTYNGKPLYYYAADKAPGDTNGEGLNGVWFLAKP